MGIDCDSFCTSFSESFTTGTLVALIATPSPGDYFVGWSGDEDCTNGVVTIDATKTCLASFCPDSDADGVCDADDLCLGDDATGDSDGDGFCDELDLCPGSDDSQDADGDGVPDGCDVCVGNDATGDSDADSVCADSDCDDDDPNKVTPDACGVCGGNNSSCRIFIDGFESGDTIAWSSTVD